MKRDIVDRVDNWDRRDDEGGGTSGIQWGTR